MWKFWSKWSKWYKIVLFVILCLLSGELIVISILYYKKKEKNNLLLKEKKEFAWLRKEKEKRQKYFCKEFKEFYELIPLVKKTVSMETIDNLKDFLDNEVQKSAVKILSFTEEEAEKGGLSGVVVRVVFKGEIQKTLKILHDMAQEYLMEAQLLEVDKGIEIVKAKLFFPVLSEEFKARFRKVENALGSQKICNLPRGRRSRFAEFARKVFLLAQGEVPERSLEDGKSLPLVDLRDFPIFPVKEFEILYRYAVEAEKKRIWAEVKEVGDSRQFRITGIIVGDKKVAIINGEPYQEGEEIKVEGKTCTVERIESRELIINCGGERKRYRPHPN